MSLPGLSFQEPVPQQAPASSGEVVEIGANSEWRVEVGFDETLTVKVTEGTAEIFGTELPNDTPYKFSGQKFAIYSHEGAKVEYTGQLASEYTSEETQMTAYMNLHFALCKIREEQERGPRVLILGAKDTGKSTLSKILAAYANRMDYEPMVVNLNPADGVFSLPGSISAAPISDILDVEDGWGHSYTTGVTPLHPKQPNVRYYGFTDIRENLKFYKHCVSKLGVSAGSRASEDPIVRKSGLIIDTPPLTIKDAGVIEDIISDFEVDIVITLGNERLFVDMKKRFGSKLTVAKVPKSDGCVDRDETFMRQTQQRAIKEYFYGTPKTPLNPYTAHVDFSVVKVFKPAAETSSSIVSSVLPIGEFGEAEEEEVKPTILEPVENSAAMLQHCVVALLQADKNDDPEVIARSGVLGYAVITGVDDEKKNMGLLIPVPGRLPDKAMVLGSFRYVE